MDKILKASYFASQKHLKQKRKDNKSPYITHPLTVALILGSVTDNEHIVIAGILHDTIEDTDTSLKEIKKLFGEEVSKLVWEVTEEDKSLSWKERKEAYLKRIESISHEGALVKSADILHNLYELKQKVTEEGTTYFDNFNASAEEKLGFETKQLTMLKKHHPNLLLEEIEELLSYLKGSVNV